MSRRTRKRDGKAGAEAVRQPEGTSTLVASSDSQELEETRGWSGPGRVYDFADSLQERSQDVEQKRQTKPETWVTFKLDGETFAFPVGRVQEILRVRDITRVPHSPYTVRGIVNMRGRVIPVMDLRLRLGLRAVEIDRSSRILVTSTRNRFIGLLVDAVEEVVRLDRLRVEPVPNDVMTERSEYILGIYQHGEKFLILLDAERVLLIPDTLHSLR